MKPLLILAKMSSTRFATVVEKVALRSVSNMSSSKRDVNPVCGKNALDLLYML